MFKNFVKITSFILCFVILAAFGGCAGNNTVQVDLPSSSEAPVSSEPEPTFAVNPLTGIENLDPAAVNNRPVAVMINNLYPTAQSVQTGLNQADIVYEAYAEGGVTRLLAVFKDISKITKIGTIRSARYSYIDLAMGHDAIYVHAGINKSHATPHVKETGIDNINLLGGGFSGMSFREKNGKAYEHTLYTTGEKLSSGFKKIKWRTELKNNKGMWQSFVTDDAEVTPTAECETITVTMSSAYVSKFTYDKTTKTYKKFSAKNEHKDYVTGKQLEFKNVLVLKTDITPLGNEGVVKTGLTGGEGYYVTNGGYQKIKWSKGSTSNPIKITLENGKECAYNPGNTWVCLVNKNNSVKITAPAAKNSSTPASK